MEKSSEGSCHPSVETECAQDSYCQDQGDSEKNKLQSDKVISDLEILIKVPKTQYDKCHK